jgi:hypothetical protein
MISSRVASDFNAILATQVQIVGYSKAVYTASNRATGAADANNKTWVDKQTQAARGFLGKLSSLYLQQSDNFKRLKKDWSLNVLLSPGRDYNEEFRGDLVSNPNAPTVVAITNGLKKMGLGSDEIEDVLVIMSGSHTDTRPGLLPSPTSVPPPAMYFPDALQYAVDANIEMAIKTGRYNGGSSRDSTGTSTGGLQSGSSSGSGSLSLF